jgi:diguanylate cyclase (GGDEF)-like protein/PAS domain S-box-containing protein
LLNIAEKHLVGARICAMPVPGNNCVTREARSVLVHTDHLHLLIVEESKNDAESLAHALRNEGYQIHFNHGSTPEDIETALNEQNPDIVLCGSGAAIPTAEAVHRLLGKHELTAPVIAIADSAPEADVVAAHKAGLSCLISYDQPDHLQQAFSREIEVLRQQREIAELKNALRSSETRCHTLIENSSDAVAYIHDGMHVYSNRPYMDLFAISNCEEVEGTPILDMISESHRDTFRGFLKSYLEEDTENNVHDIDCLNPDGEVFHCSMELSPATMDGEPCTQIIIRVNASNAELEKKIESLSRLDNLTGLTNRQHFMKLLEGSIRDDNSTNVHRALLYITLDNFKVVREEHGIASSDIVLCDIANILEENCSENDYLSRFGDYCFAMLHYDQDEEKTLALGETLLHKISGHLSEVDGRTITMTASIGIFNINSHPGDAQTSISYADMACEVARSSGGNQIHTHSAVVDEHLGQENEQEWDNVVRATIEEERFYLAYQPIVSLKGDTRQRYEVLLRVIDRDGHAILPGQFLAIAEKTGLSGTINRWIISSAFRSLAETQEDNHETMFFIKLSGPTLADADLPVWINEQLKENRLTSDSVVFEIPERAAIVDLKSTIAFVKSMQSLNCKVVFEHYGNSDQPQLLKHIPVDILKIDGTLISGLASSKEHQSRVKAILELAKENGKEVIAECVDDAGSLAQLWQYGVDFIQGNFVQEPSKNLDYDFEGEMA